MERLGVFSLQSATSYAERGVGRSQAIKAMLKRERKALAACRKGHNRALGQSESQLLVPARHLSFHGGNLSYLVT